MANIKQFPDGSASFFSELEQTSLWHVGGPKTPTAGSGQKYHPPFKVVVPLNTTGQGTAALAAWQNPFQESLLVTHTAVVITTAQTNTVTISVGQVATNTSLGNNLIDAFAAAGVAGATAFDNITDKGAAGKSRVVMAVGDWITVSTSAGGSATSFVGSLYLEVTKL